jgi:hypothetical protein
VRALHVCFGTAQRGRADTGDGVCGGDSESEVAAAERAMAALLAEEEAEAAARQAAARKVGTPTSRGCLVALFT